MNNLTNAEKCELPKHELLLKEYELCEKFASDTGSQYWRITALFLPIAFGSLALVIGVNLSEMNRLAQRVMALLIVLTGFVFVSMLYFWRTAVLRALWYQHIAYCRAREIEGDMRLRKNLYIHALDNWSSLSEEDKERYQQVYDQVYADELKRIGGKGSPRGEMRSPRRVSSLVTPMFWLGSLVWMLVVILKFLEAWGIINWLWLQL
jgi:hypothetical protein